MSAVRDGKRRERRQGWVQRRKGRIIQRWKIFRGWQGRKRSIIPRDRRDSSGRRQTGGGKGSGHGCGQGSCTGQNLAIEPKLGRYGLPFIHPWHGKRRGRSGFQVLDLDVTLPPILEFDCAVLLVLLDGSPSGSSQFRDQQPSFMVILVAGNPCFLYLGNRLAVQCRRNGPVLISGTVALTGTEQEKKKE